MTSTHRRARLLLACTGSAAIGIVATAVLFSAIYQRILPTGYIANFPESLAHVWSGKPPLPLPPLRSFAEGRSDEAAYAAIRAYYEAERDTLALLFNETDDQRLRGLFAMALTHLAHPYGPREGFPMTLSAFLAMPMSDCGAFTTHAGRIGMALGLEARGIVIGWGNHAVTEFRIGDHWEVFDATYNTWYDISIEAMFSGAERRYRVFYSPMTDPNAPRIEGFVEGWHQLRGDIPQWGLAIARMPLEYVTF